MNYKVAQTIAELVKFGFDVRIHAVTPKDVIISIATDNPAWVKEHMEKIANQCECDHTFYMDADRVHGYLYQY